MTLARNIFVAALILFVVTVAITGTLRLQGNDQGTDDVVMKLGEA